MAPNTHPVVSDHDQPQQDEPRPVAGGINSTEEVAPPPTYENKRQISERTNATVETTALGVEPVPPLSQSIHNDQQEEQEQEQQQEQQEDDTTGSSSSQQQEALTRPSLLSRHVTVYDELHHFKSLNAPRRSTTGDDGDDSSYSRPGAHRVDGMNASATTTSGTTAASDGNNENDEGRSGQTGGQDQPRGQTQQQHLSGTETGNGAAAVANDPFAEPYNVPSAYVVDEESQLHLQQVGTEEEGSDAVVDQTAAPPMPMPPAPVVTVSGTLSNFATVGSTRSSTGDDEMEKDKRDKNKGSGCAVKFPCCEMRLSTPCLVAFAVVAVVIAVIAIVLVALLANGNGGGGVDTDPLGVTPVPPVVESPVTPPIDPVDPPDNPVEPVPVGPGPEEPEPVEPGLEEEPDPTEPRFEEPPIESNPTMSIPEVLTDCEWQKILAIDGAPDKRFGQHVAIEGDVLAVSAPRDNDSRGSVYIYERTNVSVCCWSIWYEPAPDTRWKFTKKLVADADNGQPGDELAFIDLSKTTIAAGAKKATVDGKSDAGAVYVWTRNDDGKWKPEAKLTADDGQENDMFGNTLSIDKDVMIITARLSDAVFEDSGAAYVYRRTDGKWKQEQKLIPDDAKAYDQFGSRVELQGDYAVVTAYTSDDRGTDSGSAYVWKYNGEEFEQEAKLLPNDGAPYDAFGINVAIDTYGKNIVIGAYNDTEKGVTARVADKDGVGSGAAYVFSFTPTGQWAQSSKILAADGDKGHRFGRQVALNGNILVISSLSSYMLPNSGAIYVFRRTSDTTWEQQRKLMTNHQVEDSFGSDLALDGLTILAGARYDTDNGYRSGSAHIIELC